MQTKPQNTATKRNFNLDLIRAVAVFSVLSVHFFLNNGFYQAKIQDVYMLIMITMRTAFMVCVPLFLMLTGYLMNRKELSAKYYKSLPKTLVLYLLATLLLIAFRHFYLKEPFSFGAVLLNITGFEQYAWYINMYIGLFLLIPFLNLIWNHLASQKQRLLLVGTLLLLTALPAILNVKDPILPDWWSNLYPISYYFLGAYLKTYDLPLRKSLNLLLLLASILLFGGINYLTNAGKTFAYTSAVAWGSLQNVIDAVLLFTLLLHLKTNRLPAVLKKPIETVSRLSLTAYLVSYLFDKLFYPILNNAVPEVPNRLPYYFVIVPAVFICSLVTSWLLQELYRFLCFLTNRCILCVRKIRN